MVLSVKIIEPPIKDSSKYLAFIMGQTNELILSITRVCNEREREKESERVSICCHDNQCIGIDMQKEPVSFYLYNKTCT